MTNQVCCGVLYRHGKHVYAIESNELPASDRSIFSFCDMYIISVQTDFMLHLYNMFHI